MASSTSTTKASLCLLLLVVIMASMGAASAANINNNTNRRPLPGSCLMAASTLCANADTNAMRCLRKLAIQGDVRVPNACAKALMAGVTMNPRLKKQAARPSRLSRMLTEAGSCAGPNNCPNDFGAVPHQRCNDVQMGCSGCPQGTFTITANTNVATVAKGGPNSINCANLCCKAANGNAACCISYLTTFNGLSTKSVFCNEAGNANCQLP